MSDCIQTEFEALDPSWQWALPALLSHLACGYTQADADEERQHYRRGIITAGILLEQHLRERHPQLEQYTPAQWAALIAAINRHFCQASQPDSTDPREIILSGDCCGGMTHVQAGRHPCMLRADLFAVLLARCFGYAEGMVELCAGKGRQCCRMRFSLQADERATGNGFTSEETRNVEMLPANMIPTQSMGDDRGRDASRCGNCAHQHELTRMKQAFLANITHELRTPLTTMHGYLTLLAQEDFGALPAVQHEALGTVMRNLRQLTRMVDDLLDLSAIDSTLPLRCEPVDVADLAVKGAQAVRQLAKRTGVAISCRLTPLPGIVSGDREKLARIITHLLENAVKFSRTGQTVTLSARRTGDAIYVTVADRGIGIPHEQLATLFTPFVQGESGLARRYDGLGIGLPLVRNLIELHGGDLTIRSRAGAGTAVTMRLPVCAEE